MGWIVRRDLGSTLNQRVTIKSRDSGQDSIGQPVDTWTAVATDIAAGIATLSGLETIRAGEVSSVTKASIVIRWRTGVDSGMRVYHGSTVYEIKSVQPDYERRDRVFLVCETTNGDT